MHPNSRWSACGVASAVGIHSKVESCTTLSTPRWPRLVLLSSIADLYAITPRCSGLGYALSMHAAPVYISEMVRQRRASVLIFAHASHRFISFHLAVATSVRLSSDERAVSVHFRGCDRSRTMYRPRSLCQCCRPPWTCTYTHMHPL